MVVPYPWSGVPGAGAGDARMWTWPRRRRPSGTRRPRTASEAAEQGAPRPPMAVATGWVRQARPWTGEERPPRPGLQHRGRGGTYDERRRWMMPLDPGRTSLSSSRRNSVRMAIPSCLGPQCSRHRPPDLRNRSRVRKLLTPVMQQAIQVPPGGPVGGTAHRAARKCEVLRQVELQEVTHGSRRRRVRWEAATDDRGLHRQTATLVPDSVPSGQVYVERPPDVAQIGGSGRRWPLPVPPRRTEGPYIAPQWR